MKTWSGCGNIKKISSIWDGSGANGKGKNPNLNAVTPVYYSIIMNTMDFLQLILGRASLMPGSCILATFNFRCTFACVQSLQKLRAFLGPNFCLALQVFSRIFSLLSRYKQQRNLELRGRARHHGKLHCWFSFSSLATLCQMCAPSFLPTPENPSPSLVWNRCCVFPTFQMRALGEKNRKLAWPVQKSASKWIFIWNFRAKDFHWVRGCAGYPMPLSQIG